MRDIKFRRQIAIEILGLSLRWIGDIKRRTMMEAGRVRGEEVA
jgi:hypothetical protein